MAASKTEVHISKLVDKIETKVQQLYMFSRSSYPMGTSKMLYNQTGSKTSNMAAFKPEVHIAKLVDKIGTKVQRLYACF